MDWKTAVDAVRPYAPTIASALGTYGAAAGGPVGVGAAIAAKAVTEVLGVREAPEDVYDLTRTQEGRQQLNEAEMAHKVELQKLILSQRQAELTAESQQLQRTHETIRAELQADSFFKSGWRPATGWLLAFGLGALMVAVVINIFRDPRLLANGELLGLLAWVVGTMGAILGINIKQRSNDKARRMGYQPHGFLGAINFRGRDE